MNNEFPLRGLEFWKELEGKRHHDLPLIIQRGLARRTINAVVLLAETMKDDNEDMDIRKILFKRLNTGGVQLNPQELRNALYPSAFNELITELSRHDLFTEAWGIPKRTDDEEENPSALLLKNTLFKSMADCELILRFFGIKRLITMQLGGSLRSILDKTAKAYQFSSNSELMSLRKSFEESITGLSEIFGESLFIMPSTGKLSRPLYDAFMVAYSLVDKDKITSSETIINKLSSISSDSISYDILTGKGNTTESIKDRIELAKSILTA
ncbi:hypothetical protein [Serratia fonticola]|uniref:hypothetical protein n=1 Tax=Serratia fonticola TaxID=47917 RepID=UPI003BB48A60